jgi:hypothetical protein
LITRRTQGSIVQLRQFIEQAEKTTLTVGFHESAKYADGTPVATVAAENEFGVPSRRQPPRPFMRPTIAAKRQEFLDLLGKGSKAALRGQFTLIQVFDQVGLKVAGEIRRTISKLTSPALSPRTIQERRLKYASNQQLVGGLTKPLVETGLMIASVTHEVKQS